MKETIIGAYEYALKHGGASFGLNGLISEKKGYLVSLKSSEVILDTLTVDNLTKYVESKLGILNTVENVYIGVWYSEGLWYFDVSFHYMDRSLAINCGLVGEQKAIYDLENSLTISLK